MNKKLVSVFVACVLIFGIGIGAYAESTLETISAYLNRGIHLKVNGQEFQAKDADTGKTLYPITYDGSTYLPVRAAGEAIGAHVGYDNASQTVSLDSSSGGSISYAFTQAGDKPETKLINVIAGAKQTLDIAIYSLTHPDIIQAIKDAKSRGVSVRIITDKIQSSGKSQTEALKILGSAGIPTKINTHSGLMHLKVTIADKKIATTGSYNYSKAASTTNDEVLLVLQDEAIAKSFSGEFEKMWNDESNFITIEKYIAQGDSAAGTEAAKEEVKLSTACEIPTIKGNINSSKEKIYHVPGGQFYDKTQAEEMFCTASDAEAAGYRASSR